MKNETSVKIPWNFEGKRFDWVAQALTEELLPEKPLPRELVKEAIINGSIFLNGQEADPKKRLSRGDRITFLDAFYQYIEEKSLKSYPEGVSLPEIIAKEDDFLVIMKPAGLLTHGVADFSGEASLEDWLLDQGEVFAAQNGRVHRLDRQTSGLILYAKNEEAVKLLKELFQEREIKKTYITLVEGVLEDEEGIINAPIERINGSFKRKIAQKNQGKSAETEYQVTRRYPQNTLVFAFPKTGRTHQIRVHFSSLGHPLVGDGLYGGSKALIGRQFLHAWELQFSFKGEKYHFKTPLPTELQSVLKTLDESKGVSYDNEALQNMKLKQ